MIQDTVPTTTADDGQGAPLPGGIPTPLGTIPLPSSVPSLSGVASGVAGGIESFSTHVVVAILAAGVILLGVWIVANG